jgi:hypothetical protein
MIFLLGSMGKDMENNRVYVRKAACDSELNTVDIFSRRHDWHCQWASKFLNNF